MTAECDSGTLVVDATDGFDVDQVGAAAYFTYLDGTCPEGTIAHVTITWDKSLKVQQNKVEIVAFYEKDSSDLDDYVDGTPMPDCVDEFDVNCVDSISTGKDGTTAQFRMLLTDPMSIGRR